MKIYISLPITGYDLQERKRYAENVKKKLRQIYTDSEIITPFDVNPDPTLPYRELIDRCVDALIKCDAVYFCNGSSHSKGCRLEYHAALFYGKIITNKEDFDIKVEPSNPTSYCGECPLFRYEDTDGFGICHVSSREQRCSDTCQFLSAPPTPRQAAKLLHYAQKWRRGKKCAMLPPAILGVAIDMAIRTLRKC